MKDPKEIEQMLNSIGQAAVVNELHLAMHLMKEHAESGEELMHVIALKAHEIYLDGVGNTLAWVLEKANSTEIEKAVKSQYESVKEMAKQLAPDAQRYLDSGRKAPPKQEPPDNPTEDLKARLRKPFDDKGLKLS